MALPHTRCFVLPLLSVLLFLSLNCSICVAQPLSLKHGVISADESGFTLIDSFSLPGQPSGDVVASTAINVTDANYDPQSKSALWWALYADSQLSWPVVLAQKSNWTCAQLLTDFPSGPAMTSQRFVSWEPINNGSSSMTVRFQQKLRHFWFAVVARVSTESPMSSCVPIDRVHYSVSVTHPTEHDSNRQQRHTVMATAYD